MQVGSHDQPGHRAALPIAVAAWSVPVIAVLVACLQVLASQALDLSSWKGGGFGMFATIEKPEARLLVVALESDEGSLVVGRQELVDAGVAAETIYRARAMPDRDTLSRIRDHVGRTQWGSAEPSSDVRARRPGDQLMDVERVRVEVYGLRYDAATGRASRYLLASVES